MKNIAPLIENIFFGEFGLLTMTPKYLFLTLFPIMVLINFLSSSNKMRSFSGLSYIATGLGCNAGAIMACSNIKASRPKLYFILFLTFLVPCSAQLSMILTFTALVSLKVFLAYALIVFATTLPLAYFFHKAIGPLKTASISQNAPSLVSPIKEAFTFVLSATPSFSIGSVIISLMDYFKILESLAYFTKGFFSDFLGLPPSSCLIFLLNLIKRDFGFASLLAYAKDFASLDLLIIMLLLTFTTPCINSFIAILRELKLPLAACIWLGSLTVSLLICKFFRCVFSIFLV